jgi:rhamnose transport system permease protein
MLAKTGMPTLPLFAAVLLIGAAMGTLNGALIGLLKLPSIIVTLAMLVVWRDALRWATEGAWVQDLPSNFQWFGLRQSTGEFVIFAVTMVFFVIAAWSMRNMVAGRKVYAVGSEPEAARLAGIEPQRVVFWVFIVMGALVGVAALLNAIRFSSVPGNTGVGLELKAIAAVVVGGTAITGGRGRLVGTLIGVALLGTIGTVLTFVGINPFWEKAIQGAIILAALASDVVLGRIGENGHFYLISKRTA